MNVETITMDKEKAKEAFRQYREAVRERHSHEDEAIMRGYKALSNGSPLIDVGQAIIKAGVDHRFLPRLAISRADFKKVYYRGSRRGLGTFNPVGQYPKTIRGGHFDVEGLPTWENDPWSHEAEAVVPIIPSNLRPKGSLKRFHILFEADWEAVPRDPMMLRHMGGNLFAVLAVWDLTEIERAVLAGTRK